MAEFEELRLTVNLVDNASSGLQRLRAGLGDLTKSTDAMTQSLTTGFTAITNLGTATTNAAPHVRSIGQASRDAARSAHELKEGFMRMNVATQGLSSLPAIASNVRDLGFAVHGLSSAFSLVGTAASVAVMGVAAVAVAVVGLGAVVVAYGVSVFKFAGEMDQLSRTAKQMGMGFASLKYATDQAKQFGYSADMVIRSYQGIQAAQLDLYKNNSELRATLLGQGVDAGWIAQLSKLDPNQARSAIIKYSKQLEAQALASGAMKGNAARLKAQFLKEFGLTAADADMPELKPPSPEKRAQLEEIDRYSKLIMGVWGEMTFEWTKFKTELLATSLPVLRDSMIGLKGKMPAILKELKIWIEYAVSFLPGLVGKIPIVVKKVGVALKGVISLFQGVITTLKYITHPWDTLRRRAHPSLQKLMGWDEFMSKENEDAWAERRRQGDYSMWDKERWGMGTPSDEALHNWGMERVNPGDYPDALTPAPPPTPPPGQYGPRQQGPWVPPHQLRKNTSYSGGANDNNPLLQRVSFTQNELKDEVGSVSEEMAKLTRQLEKLNDYIDRTGGGGGGSGGGGGGFQNATFGGSAGAAAGGGYTGQGAQGGGGNYGGASGTYNNGGNGGPAALSDQDGKGIDPETMKQVETLGRAGDTAGLNKLFAAKGYRMNGPACGIVASKYVMSAGFKPPKGGAIASNWNDWGEKQDKSDINNPNRPFGSMIASYSERRYGGNVGAPLGKGQTGGHVMNIVPGSYDAKTNTAMFADQYGVKRRPIKNMDIRYAGDSAVAEVREKRGGGNDSARVDGANDNARVDGVSPAEAGSGSAYLAAKRAGFRKELEDPGTRKLLGGILSAENPGAGPAVVESLMNRTELVNESRARRGLPPKTLKEMIVGNGGKSFYGPIRSGAINEHLAKMNNPAYAAQMNKQIDAALGGSNTIGSHTDQGSKGDPNYVAGGVGVNINGERFNDWGYAGSAAWRQRRQREIAEADTAKGRPTVARAELSRETLTADKAADVQTDGKLKAEVTAPSGTKVEVSGSGAFKNTETSKTTTMSRETANKLLATN
jgi:hypothetical protein